MTSIDGDRLLEDLQTLRTFGACGNGVVRQTFSEPDMAARRWLRDRMEQAGLEAVIDGVGNVFGRSPNPGPALVIGSHSDTQPNGGWLDGALGVMYAIEVARALAEDPATADLAVDAVAWSDEESTYTSCLGSNSFVGRVGPEVLTQRSAAGESVAEAIDRVGLASVPRVRFEADRHIGYLEAHIEQGPHLEEENLLIGVVTSIVGIRGATITFSGQQNHAGTTPMARRADAGVSLFEFGVRLRDRLGALAGPSTVWTVGNVRLEPGAPSIIPGLAEMIIQFRDPDQARLQAMSDAIVQLGAELSDEGPVAVEVTPGRSPIAPTVMDDRFQEHIARAAERVVPGRWVHMPSAAGHDPMALSDHLPCAMLFIPSIGGISHDFAEDSRHEDIATGCQVLAGAAASILSELRN